ncbi:guanylate kinase [Plectosphaerella plurivora]|uniref:Guanylate kinase n=1 Tax=Plectosphaerella plurivora TaxID=936078 RepID=A0A9P8VAP6_9PEZI|nr:guanylate kinase [Plectosphaerella plurivora]
MPAATTSDYNHVPSVVSFSSLLDELLARAANAKPSATIEPALQPSDFGNFRESIAAIFSAGDETSGDSGATATPNSPKTKQFAAIETATRNLFCSLIASTAIESPDFVRVWNLFDLISVLSDDEQCEAGLLFWLMEELLDSQTIAGCRRIFDYLESRRERITTKHWNKKHLVILRSCNELLRRLSRAEDTAFCGRVFIFLFQSFPLGDRSSVNLRGEYHVENVTAYDEILSTDPQDAADKMNVDTDPKSQTKAVSFNGDKDASQDPTKPEALYSTFWTLQESFSQPKRLFDVATLASFKTGLEATLKTFRTIQEEQGNRPAKSANAADGANKRKRENEEGSGAASAFNPKYLTSRDLFELEISDLSFRRHILVQAFIIVEFLLSLSKAAKEKVKSVKNQNKSVMYLDYELSDEDTTWALNMKKTVEDCLKQGSDGAQFHRMIDTVLARDKNWVRWKVESCQPIEREAVKAEDFAKAQDELRRMTANKRRRGMPLNSLSLDFMRDSEHDEEMENFKQPDRYQLPELASFQKSISNDDLEIEMPTNDESKAEAIESKASKQWRALRIAAKTKMSMLEKISDPENIDPIFGEPEDPDAVPDETAAEDKAEAPTDQRPLVISGPLGAGKSALSDLLIQRNPGTFAFIKRHTTRKLDGTNDSDHQFIEKQAFDMLRDGDVLLEYTTIDEFDYGTSRRAVEASSTAGKVPLVFMDAEAVQQARDNGFNARFILITPPTKEALEDRLKKAGKAEEAVALALASAEPFLAEDNAEQTKGFDLVVVNDDLEIALTALREFIYGAIKNGEEAQDPASTDGAEVASVEAVAEPTTVQDTEMNDVAAPSTEAA